MPGHKKQTGRPGQPHGHGTQQTNSCLSGEPDAQLDRYGGDPGETESD